jgi:hypothetical protein
MVLPGVRSAPAWGAVLLPEQRQCRPLANLADLREQHEVIYQLIRQPNAIVDRLFEIEFLDPGVETFSFTFG